jgi:hypothetical protein
MLRIMQGSAEELSGNRLERTSLVSVRDIATVP